MAAANIEPTVMTLTIADHTVIQKTAAVVAKRGSRAAMGQVKFTNSTQLAEGIVALLTDLAGQDFDAAVAAKAKQPPKRAAPPGAAKPTPARTSDATASPQPEAKGGKEPKKPATKKPTVPKTKPTPPAPASDETDADADADALDADD